MHLENILLCKEASDTMTASGLFHHLLYFGYVIQVYYTQLHIVRQVQNLTDKRYLALSFNEEK